jgi:hypothetical protein
VNSFTPGTAVVLASGATVPIEDVQLGDEVLATDPETGQTGPKPVTALITGDGQKELTTITITNPDGDADGSGTVVATDGHPFWVPERGEWVDAGDLLPGYWLATSAGTLVQITAIQHDHRQQTVHNLTVADTHTYYVVAGSTDLLVHNCGGAAPRPASSAVSWPPNNGFHGQLGPHGNPGVTVLKPGTLVDRFGIDGGRFVAPNGTPIGQRSLAPGTTDKPYSVFEVTNRLVVQQGPAEPWFGQPGMGTQYHLPSSVEDLIDTGFLRRVG